MPKAPPIGWWCFVSDKKDSRSGFHTGTMYIPQFVSNPLYFLVYVFVCEYTLWDPPPVNTYFSIISLLGYLCIIFVHPGPNANRESKIGGCHLPLFTREKRENLAICTPCSRKFQVSSIRIFFLVLSECWFLHQTKHEWKWHSSHATQQNTRTRITR